MVYKNLARETAEDEELERLEAEYRKEFGEPSDENLEVEKGDSKTKIDKEEETWKKRHSDLRSYTSKQINDLQKEINGLKTLLASKDNETKFPVNKEEAEEWVQSYPDLARVIGTLIDERAGSMVNPLTEEVKNTRLELEAERTARARERAMSEILQVHPDFLQLINEDDFKEWVEAQPSDRGPVIGQALYDALYKNETDATAAIQAVNIYKSDKGMNSKPKKKTSDEAAFSVTPSKSAPPKSEGNKNQFLESEIEKMKPWEFDKLEEEIEKARREGRIIYDISGAAR